MPWRTGRAKKIRSDARLPIDLVQAMLDPSAYPEPPDHIEMVQTHLSNVFFCGKHVYKVKKPVNFGFLDFSTLEQRKHFCHREVELNKRLSPNTYLGVVEINRDDGRITVEGSGEVVEHAVKMRRLPQGRMMDVMLDNNQVTQEMVVRVARLLADFHKSAQSNPEISLFGNIETLSQNTEENFAQTEPYVGRTIDAEKQHHIKSWTQSALRDNAPLFQQRVEQGKIKDCHGDVHSAHICLENGISIYDCIEFNDRFRYGDVAAEVAFLAMDLDAHGRPDLSHRFVSAYIESSGDRDLLKLLGFYKCYRAYVRGKVESFELDDAEVPEPKKEQALSHARHYFDLAYTYTLGTSLLVLTGLVGTGKTHLAQALSRRAGFAVISSDIVRKELAGIPATEQRLDDFDGGIYSPEFSQRTYDEMLRRADDYLSGNQSVVMDASFKNENERQRAQGLAQAKDVKFLLVECKCDESTIKRRLEERANEETPSDGRWEIYQEQKKDYEPVRGFASSNHVVVDTTHPSNEVVEEIISRVGSLAQ